MTGSPDEELRSVLAAQIRAAGWPEALVDHVGSYFAATEDTPDGVQALEALREKREPGAAAIITSRRPWNVIVHWKKLVISGAKTAGAVVATLTGPAGIAAWIAWALTTLPDLFELPTIELSEKHSEVVRFLWLDHESAPSLPMTTVRQAFASWDQQEFDRLMADLVRLRIIAVEGPNVVKRDELVGTKR